MQPNRERYNYKQIINKLKLNKNIKYHKSGDLYYEKNHKSHNVMNVINPYLSSELSDEGLKLIALDNQRRELIYQKKVAHDNNIMLVLDESDKIKLYLLIKAFRKKESELNIQYLYFAIDTLLSDSIEQLVKTKVNQKDKPDYHNNMLLKYKKACALTTQGLNPLKMKLTLKIQRKALLDYHVFISNAPLLYNGSSLFHLD